MTQRSRLTLLGLLLTCAACARADQQAARNARIAALEAQVAQLRENIRTLHVLVDPVTQPARPTTAEAREFRISCPSRWVDLGAIEQTLWACRSPVASANGLWPNCNVTRGKTHGGSDAKTYFSQSMSASAAERCAAHQRRPEHAVQSTELPRGYEHNLLPCSDGVRALSLHGMPAHEAIYTHRLTPQALQVLATLGLVDGHAFALTCTAPPASFSKVEPMFRAIIDSVRVERAS